MTISLREMTQDHARRLPPHNRGSRAVKDGSAAVGRVLTMPSPLL